MKRRVLIVSPHFPPVNAPDMQRVRVSLPHFVEAGWEVTVLTVADPTPTAPVDPELLTTVPSSVQVVRTHCCSRRWTGWLGINNVALRSLPFLFFAGWRLLRGQPFEVIYFSTTMFIVLPFGRIWRWLSGTPYVVDLQDPWVTDYYSLPGSPPPPGGWKYRFAQGLAVLLEGWSLRRVAHIITVSPVYGETLRHRHPWLQPGFFTDLPFGSPDDDLQRLRETLATRPPILPPGRLRLAFAGALGPGMLSSVELLFAALGRCNDGTISVHFHGTSYSHLPNPEPATLRLAKAYGLASCVSESPRRLRYFEALQVTLEAEVNLLFGSEELSFVPSKVLAVLATGRPLLAIAPAGSALLERLSVLNSTGVSFPARGSREAAIEEIHEKLRAAIAGRLPATDMACLEGMGGRVLAARQLALLESSSAHRNNF
jgi:hypothetical protein